MVKLRAAVNDVVPGSDARSAVDAKGDCALEGGGGGGGDIDDSAEAAAVEAARTAGALATSPFCCCLGDAARAAMVVSCWAGLLGPSTARGLRAELRVPLGAGVV